MKKLAAALFAATLAFSTVGPIVMDSHQGTITAEAKGYKSGKRGFNSNESSNNNSLFNSNKSNTNSNTKDNSNSIFGNKKTNNKTNTANPTGTKGGFLKGMMVGGLAGMLFGGMMSHMGAMGNIFGLLINVIAILVLIMLVMKIFQMFTRNKRKDEERNVWKR